MAFRILTNIPSEIAQRELEIARRALTRALERLSSGLRINRAEDDAAGYGIAAQTQLQIIGTDTGASNLRLAVDLLNTADTYVRTVMTTLERMAELAYQATNELLTPAQRSALNFEFRELQAEIQRLTTNAAFLGRLLLTGDLLGVSLQAGFSVTDIVVLTIPAMTLNALFTIAGGSHGIGTVASAQVAVGSINAAVVGIVAPNAAVIGAQAASWLRSADAQRAYATNLRAARSRIMDADLAAETTNLTNAQVIVQSGIAALAQANAAQALALGLLGPR